MENVERTIRDGDHVDDDAGLPHTLSGKVSVISEFDGPTIELGDGR